MEILVHHKLFAKLSKCCFAVEEIDYLGHLISQHGVRADPTKLEAMVNWHLLLKVKSLRVFWALPVTTGNLSGIMDPWSHH